MDEYYEVRVKGWPTYTRRFPFNDGVLRPVDARKTALEHIQYLETRFDPEMIKLGIGSFREVERKRRS